MPSNKNISRKKSKKTLWLVIGIIAIIVAAVGVFIVMGNLGNQAGNQSPSPTTSPVSSSDSNGTKVLFQTTAGNFTVQLRTDKPITTANFLNIVNKGWYDDTTFHRVVAGFMIQGGQISESVPPIQDEIGTNNHNTPYTIAMAKTSQPNSATSEFFINVADNSKITYQDGTTFDGTYTVFGTVISGTSVVDAIANAPVTTNPQTGEDSMPVNPVTVISVSVIS